MSYAPIEFVKGSETRCGPVTKTHCGSALPGSTTQLGDDLRKVMHSRLDNVQMVPVRFNVEYVHANLRRHKETVWHNWMNGKVNDASNRVPKARLTHVMTKIKEVGSIFQTCNEEISNTVVRKAGSSSCAQSMTESELCSEFMATRACVW